MTSLKYIAFVMEHINELLEDNDDLAKVEEQLFLVLKVVRKGLQEGTKNE